MDDRSFILQGTLDLMALKALDAMKPMHGRQTTIFDVPRAQEIGVDGIVLAFTAILSVGAVGGYCCLRAPPACWAASSPRAPSRTSVIA